MEILKSTPTTPTYSSQSAITSSLHPSIQPILYYQFPQYNQSMMQQQPISMPIIQTSLPSQASLLQSFPTMSSISHPLSFSSQSEEDDKKLRRVKNPQQLKILKSFYSINIRPNKEQLRSLVLTTHLPLNEITRWFRNERHKDKKSHTSKTFTAGSYLDSELINNWMNEFYEFDHSTRMLAIEKLLKIAQPNEINTLKQALTQRFNDENSSVASEESIPSLTSATNSNSSTNESNATTPKSTSPIPTNNLFAQFSSNKRKLNDENEQVNEQNKAPKIL
jgi:hypothetical protein